MKITRTQTGLNSNNYKTGFRNMDVMQDNIQKKKSRINKWDAQMFSLFSVLSAVAFIPRAVPKMKQTQKLSNKIGYAIGTTLSILLASTALTGIAKFLKKLNSN